MLDAWKEILSKQDEIEQDIQSLYKVKGVISQISQKLVLLQLDAPTPHLKLSSFIQVDPNTELTPYEAWRKNGIDELQSHLNVLESVQTA
jgi:hypothetical protein